MDKDNLIYKVSKTSDVHDLAVIFYNSVLENMQFEIQAIGERAVNQAVKGIAIATNMLMKRSVFVSNRIKLIDVVGNNEGEEKIITAVSFRFVRI